MLWAQHVLQKIESDIFPKWLNWTQKIGTELWSNLTYIISLVTKKLREEKPNLPFFSWLLSPINYAILSWNLFVVIYSFFGVNFLIQKFCLCKKNDKYEVWSPPLPVDGTHCRCVKIDIKVHDLTYCRCQRYPPLPAMSTDKYKRHS